MRQSLRSKVYDLENRIIHLEHTVRTLRDDLRRAEILHNYPSVNLTPGPISLRDMKNQIDAIKDFLGVEFIVKPEIPAKNMMKKKTKERKE